MFGRRELLRYSLLYAGGTYLSTTLSGCAWRGARSHLDPVEFAHGVASGDPLVDGVVLWTRATPRRGAAAASLGWELAEDREFRQVVRSGEVRASAARDYTVKIDVRQLEAGRDYFYRFIGADGASPAGRARTLPGGPVDHLRLAVFSCANYPAGYFHAYREASRLTSLDATVHLGDYLYEYGMGGYATDRAVELGRALPADNSGELFTLTDYRRRYALYRSDPDLQALHAAAPMIAVWDDHEIANDAWRGGAQNHQPAEGDYPARRDAAVRAYFEWMPLRPVVPDSEGRLYRGFEFGDLLSLHMLDTRLVGRDEPLHFDDFTDRETGSLSIEALQQALNDPHRELMGRAQLDWLQQRLLASRATWQVLGQQTLISRMTLPVPLLEQIYRRYDFAGSVPLLRQLVAAKQQRLSGGPVAPELLATLERSLPYNLDAWDGYPAARERLYAAARRAGKPLLVLAGDTHHCWYSKLVDDSGRPMGAELGAPAVSSPGMEDYLSLDAARAAEFAQAFTVLVDELRFCELHRRGYLQLDFSREACDARWHLLSDVTRSAYTTSSYRERIPAPG